jgi:hypothetical protein
MYLSYALLSQTAYSSAGGAVGMTEKYKHPKARFFLGMLIMLILSGDYSDVVNSGGHGHYNGKAGSTGPRLTFNSAIPKQSS